MRDWVNDKEWGKYGTGLTKLTSLDFHGTGNDLTRGDTSLHRPCARPSSYMWTLGISSTDK